LPEFFHPFRRRFGCPRLDEGNDILFSIFFSAELELVLFFFSFRRFFVFVFGVIEALFLPNRSGRASSFFGMTDAYAGSSCPFFLMLLR